MLGTIVSEIIDVIPMNGTANTYICAITITKMIISIIKRSHHGKYYNQINTSEDEWYTNEDTGKSTKVADLGGKKKPVP